MTLFENYYFDGYCSLSSIIIPVSVQYPGGIVSVVVYL
jgi:hypothetical protein